MSLRKIAVGSIGFMLILSIIVPACAVPAEPGIRTLQAKDGSSFPAQLWGDEWSHGWETADGYAILFDETEDDWTYAVAGSDGNLVSSGRVVGTESPGSATPRHLRPSENARDTAMSPGSSLSAAPAAAPEAVPATGTANVPVILVNFSDRSPAYSPADFHALLFGSGTRSMKDYYEEVSYGTFSVSPGPGGVAGWYTASRGHDYYGSSSFSPAFGWSGTLVREAVAAADPAFNFAPYDSNGDCYVDVVDIIHQGSGEEAGGNTLDIWSHSYDLNSAYWYGISDGGEYMTDDACPSGGFVKVNSYVIQPETLNGQRQTLGVFAHEYAHALGVPDLYDGTYVSAGVGAWSLMGNGCWNFIAASGDTPAELDAWSKSKLGWVVPVQVTKSNATYIRNAEQFSDAYQLLDNPGGVADWRGSGGGVGEYFLIENRQRTGFDAALPGDGLLIWHIDESVGNNQNHDHKLVDLEEADGRNDLDSNANLGDGFDPWYSAWYTSPMGFNSTSVPDSKRYNGNPSGAGVTGIGRSGAVMDAYLIAPGSVIPFPGLYRPPSDPDRDGIYEDVNGNGYPDYADVVLYFNQTDWLMENEPDPAFDLNGNGHADFSDMVLLYNEL